MSTLDIHIRPMVREHYGAMLSIYNHYILTSDCIFVSDPLAPDAFYPRLDDIAGRYPAYVALDDDGRLLGYGYVHAWKDDRPCYAGTLEVTLYMHHDVCGRGVGRQLAQAIIDECRRRGYDSLIACITAGNEPSIALCRSLGFRQASLFRGVGRKGGRLLDIVDYQLLLHD